MIQYGQTGEAMYRMGTVVAEHGDWFVIKCERFGDNPFEVKRGANIELAV